MRRATFLIFTALSTGCAGDAAMPPLAADHPANPQAPTAPLVMATTQSSAPASQPAAKTAGAVYACPMHEEVTSPDPDARCPICHMHLVPKKGVSR